ncbi:hypothetical protein M2325_000696 [Methanococcus voltae PS]|uniref:MrpA C-terminal/MbhD domain-containing protein n=1 Tax=Methanococcus voltae PS TaxID=523842 RepID=A0ABT2EVM1_METVO|nr:hypothetical protein [Methanococcus voltae]MCS3922011.1 hypothetical protein [Methanococcus voltae PS]
MDFITAEFLTIIILLIISYFNLDCAKYQILALFTSCSSLILSYMLMSSNLWYVDTIAIILGFLSLIAVICNFLMLLEDIKMDRLKKRRV